MRETVSLATVYLDGVRCLEELVGAMRSGEEDLPVPATPRWTVRGLLSHLAGVGADTIEGRLDGAPGASWTQRQVDERSALSMAEVLTEIQDNASTLALMLDTLPGPSPAWDIRVHEYDLREALGRGANQRDSWRTVALGAARLFNRRDDAPGELRVEGSTVTLAKAGEALLRVELHEFFRGAFSRRSLAQVTAWDWNEGAAAHYAATIPIFFGSRTDDQPRLD